jgi:hypothetical protein
MAVFFLIKSMALNLQLGLPESTDWFHTKAKYNLSATKKGTLQVQFHWLVRGFGLQPEQLRPVGDLNLPGREFHIRGGLHSSQTHLHLTAPFTEFPTNLKNNRT